jgi:hypothetical protein
VNRRKFLKISAGAASSLALRGTASAVKGRVVVTDHGADPTGRKDASAAVSTAIAALPRSGGTLVFPVGTYSFLPTEGTIMTFESLHGLTIEGNNSLLQFAGSARPFLFSGCSDLQVKNLRIDWLRPPFSQGIVKSAASDYFEILIDAQFPVQGNERIQALGEYDRATRLPAPNGVDAYGAVSSVTLTAPRTLRVSLAKPVGVTTGMTLVLRHQVYGSDAITLRSCIGTALSHITIYATPGLGVLGLGSTDITLENYIVATMPGSNRLLSTCADASHFVDCRGFLRISGCSFFGMGDDAVNAFASYWRVVRAIAATSFEVAGRGGSPIGAWQLPRSQDHLRFVDGKTLAPLSESTVAAATANGPNAILTLTQPLRTPVPAGSLVCNLNGSPQLSVENCHFLGNRARGVVAHSDARIEDNSFSGCSLAAILLAPDAHWMEGPAVRNVSVARNKISNCGYGRSNDRRGAVCVDTAHDPHPQVLGPRVNGGIQIVDNVFGALPVAPVFCSSATRVSILRNTIAGSPKPQSNVKGPESIVLVNAAQAVLTGNVGQSAGEILLRGCAAPLTVSGNPGLQERQTQALTD